MSDLNEINTWLRERLPGPAEYKVPGVAVAVSAGGQVIDVAAGVLSTATGVGATADSVFQVGSITKVWTATLLMQLVDEGQLDLDAPVQRYLPEFGLADPDAAAAITVRQLMCHTAGFEGDLFTDTGRGDDCVEKYVRTLVGVTQLFPPGEMFFYNNAGSCVLGRVVEVLRGKPFDACMREHLFTPLGLTHVANGADEAILFRAAVGHISPTPPRSRPSSGWRRWPVRRWAGASDGNLTAGVGTPTLDGLGAVGGGAHADDEHVLVGELPGRTALLAALLAGLRSDAGRSAPTDGPTVSGGSQP